jgi:hypothetical protein
MEVAQKMTRTLLPWSTSISCFRSVTLGLGVNELNVDYRARQ